MNDYSTSGGSGSGLLIDVLSIGSGQGSITSISVTYAGTNYNLGNDFSTGYSSGTYGGSDALVNITGLVDGQAKTIRLIKPGVYVGTGYKVGGYAGENTVNLGDNTLSIIISEIGNQSPSGTSIAIGRYSGTGGYSNSIALGCGVINSATTQANIGNVLFLDGIYNSDTQSSTPIPASKMTMKGGQVLGYVAKTANYTLTANDYLVNFTSGTVDVTLPTAVGCQGQVYKIKNTGTGIITLKTTSSQTIDGVASGILTLVQWDSIPVMSDGVNYIII